MPVFEPGLRHRRSARHARWLAPSALFAAASLALAVVAWPRLAFAQSGRDFMLESDGAHLIIRFVGKAGSLDALEREDIADISLSTMVPHRLRADVAFEAEPIDSKWARSMEPRIRSALSKIAPHFSAIHVDCRSVTCRLVLDHSNGQSVAEDRSLMGRVQGALQAFIEAQPASFEPGFLIAAHYQPAETARIKVFLHRAATPSREVNGSAPLETEATPGRKPYAD